MLHVTAFSSLLSSLKLRIQFSVIRAASMVPRRRPNVSMGLRPEEVGGGESAAMHQNRLFAPKYFSW